jgi:hypothetical protein
LWQGSGLENEARRAHIADMEQTIALIVVVVCVVFAGVYLLKTVMGLRK